MNESIATERDVYITRAFAAPRDIVWRFWTRPEHLASWFGPTGFSVPADTVTVEEEEGGRWELSMIDDDGRRYPVRGVIRVLDEPEYLEIVLGADTASGTLQGVVLRVRFDHHGSTTRMTLHQGPFDQKERDLTADGWTLSLEKLDLLLKEVAA